MIATMRLAAILPQGQGALNTIGVQLAQRRVRLDCSDVPELDPAQLEFLLAAIPADWDFLELDEVIDTQTLSPGLAAQLLSWVHRRAGRALPATPLPPSPPTQPPHPAPPVAILRERLEQLVIADLLGPSGGPEEIIDERTVRGRYMVGILAPRSQSRLPEEHDEDAPAEDGGEDGQPEAAPSKASTAAMLPSSIGMTFTIDEQASAIQVAASWGRYERASIEEDRFRNKDGSYRRVWRRVPMAGRSGRIPLREGKIETWTPHPDAPQVVVEGRMRRRGGNWIVTLFLVNGQDEPAKQKDSAWVFQPELRVAAPDGAAIFQRRQTPPAPSDAAERQEERQMAMRYRNYVEFAVGHGVSVDAQLAEGAVDRATAVWTSVVPAYEVPQTTPPTAKDIPALATLTLDMQALADLPNGAFSAHLAPLADAYEAWIAQQDQRRHFPTSDLANYTAEAAAALRDCRTALERIRAGIALLDSNPQAADAFRFANRAMALQRTRTRYAAERRRGSTAEVASFDTPDTHSWRAFQLGFILINLPGLTDPTHPDRATPQGAQANPADALADLLWFPTGGGKTEAYLGLTAYTLGIRRLQGVVAGRSGLSGVAVLMRYTLRLLTLQQFQRAAALICACEVIRREAPSRWGDEPFRVGLWVGQRSTPNSIEQAEEAVKELKKSGRASGSTPHQLTHCPWCGEAIVAGRDLVVESAKQGRARVLTYCGSLLDQCAFNQRSAPGEGLPVMVVDEEIYHRLPSLLIATVDKFAQMPWNGRTAALFGHVSGHCERHGYLTPDMEHAEQRHPPVRGGLPAALVREAAPLRPPDLIIQDELHLISGPLGTLVGLYETAIDHLASWEVGGMRVRPKVIASTATIRRAAQQVHSLFLRRVQVFPPQGLDAGDTFFSMQRAPSPETPGRRYLGICAPGIRHKTALIQAYVAFLASAQQIAEQAEAAEADPWMTLVGYFNALRELAAMRRAVDDSVSTRLRRMEQRGLTKRFLNPWSVRELTSRMSAADIPDVLNLLELPFTAAPKAGKPTRAAAEGRPIDVLLATNMISVGVDVERLGLMVVAGQPKSTAEYIQATSRVGRQRPGLVATIYNWTRPRDMSHYERFKHYHATFYQYVEALSVTPFSARALDRGLSAVLVAMARLGEPRYNPNGGAGLLDATHPAVAAAQQALATRAAHIVDTPAGDQVQAAAATRIDQWLDRITRSRGARLGYKQQGKEEVALLGKPGGDWNLFTCLMSLRDVEPTVNLILDDGGMDRLDEQAWTFSASDDPAPADEEDA
ncbi:helicase [Chloroflexia bacterium SDU3-3]|nr:helicase [Chloroflexia bacterium SDU3-3]